MIHDLDRAVYCSDGGGDDVKADTTTRLLGEHFCSGDPRSEDQVEGLLFCQPADVDTAFGRRGSHRGDVDTGAVVADRDHDLGTDLACLESDCRLRRFAGGEANLGELDAMS